MKPAIDLPYHAHGPLGPDPWMQTVTGGQWFFLNPARTDVSLYDIACALSVIPRFNGHCMPDAGCYSVAQHSMLVAAHVPTEAKIYALLHDAHEAYLGDWTTPFKRAVDALSGEAGAALREIEARAAKAIHAAFNLEWPVPPHIAAPIKEADLRAMVTEKRDLMALEPTSWGFDHVEPFAAIYGGSVMHSAVAAREFSSLVRSEMENSDAGVPE